MQVIGDWKCSSGLRFKAEDEGEGGIQTHSPLTKTGAAREGVGDVSDFYILSLRFSV